MPVNIPHNKRDKEISVIIESISRGIYGIDELGNCTFINQAALDLLGYSRSDCIGKNMHHLIHYKHKDGSIYPADKCYICISTSSKDNLPLDEEVFWRADGTSFDLRYTSNAILDNDVIKGAVITFSDITEQTLREKRLRESEEKLRTATAIAKIGYWQKDINGENRYWSDELYKIWGVTRDAFTLNFESFYQTIHPDDKARFVIDQQNAVSGKEIDFEYRIILPDGSVKWLHELGKAVNDKHGNPIIYEGTVQDITAQKLLSLSLEESNQRYNFVTKATSDAIWDWDLVKQTLFWGEGFENIFGYQLTDLETSIQSWSDHLHDDDKVRVINSIDAVINGTETNWKEEYRYLKANGYYAHVVDRGFVIRNNKGVAIRMVGAMQDVSESKKVEEELQRFTQELFKRNKELQQFGYVISHNLRSPVANIIGISNLLEIDRDDPETVDHCVKSLKVAINSLDSVIKDLSTILSINDDTAGLIKETINLSELINNVSADLAGIIEHTETIIHNDTNGIELVSHKAYLYSIFYNLISNSIKYRSANVPQISISARLEKDKVTVNVADNGIGIDLVRHEGEIFKPYKRFETSIEGKGLGLFLVKSHVEVLNGEISISSTLGKGTTFTIILPGV